VSPPTPGTDAWWRVAVREAVYTLRERGWPSTYGRRRLSTGQARPADKPDAKPPNAQYCKTANREEWRSFTLFSRLRFRETPKNGVSILPNA